MVNLNDEDETLFNLLPKSYENFKDNIYLWQKNTLSHWRGSIGYYRQKLKFNDYDEGLDVSRDGDENKDY